MFRCLLAALSVALPLKIAHADPSLREVRAFLVEHCYACHGEKKQENEKRFDTLGTELSKIETLEGWQEILDQLNMGEMPPEDSPRPDAKDTARVIDLLTARLREAYAARRSTGGETVVRRLNRFELRNTVRDLLYINDPDLRVGSVARLVDNNGNGRVENTSADPFRSFPGDEIEDGFDNIGDRLVMSDFLLKLMFDAAEESLAMATVTAERPKLETRRFAGHISKQGKGDLGRFSRELDSAFDAFYRRGTLTADALRGGVGTSANYRITLELSGRNQKHPWGELLPTNQDEPFLVNVRLYKRGTRNDHIPLARLEVPGDGKTRTFSFDTWIDKNWLPQVIWENGPSEREARTDLLLKKYLPKLFKVAPDKKTIPKEQHKKVHDAWVRKMAVALLDNYKGPIVRVHSMTLEPLIDAWPPKSHTALYGKGPAENADVEKLLLAFAQRAFRRPVQPIEIEPFVQLVRARMPGQRPASPRVIQELTFKSYQGTWEKLPDFSTLKPAGAGTLDLGLVDLRVAKVEESFGLVFTGKLIAAEAGDCHFHMASDDGARVVIDRTKVVEHDGLHGPAPKNGKIRLAAGEHTIRIEYFAYGKPNSLQLAWSGPGFSEAPLSVSYKSSTKKADDHTDTSVAVQALQVGYTAILCSPEFLYLRENRGALNDYQIASRLSYFLWSSMPDERLMELAKAGKLRDRSVRQKEVVRMLDDPKSTAFSRHFTERWLRLDKLADSPPELTGPFRVYWDRKLEPQIVAQTVAYFADVLKSNGKVRQFIDSDYTYLNESIASVFYRRDDVRGDLLRKVPTNDPRRGGIFTQPSVMTATANGVDTSPVVRGVWILENVLGTPPAPPPPDVEPLPPDLRNAKSIREQIKIHRKQDACNSCHRKIDPMGFPFENFDPIGRWRDKYPRGNVKIDASTKTSTGRAVSDVVEFKKLLVERESQVTRCLTEKLLAYASGRVLESADRGEVDRIVEKLQKSDGGLRDLIQLVVESKVFLTK